MLPSLSETMESLEQIRADLAIIYGLNRPIKGSTVEDVGGVVTFRDADGHMVAQMPRETYDRIEDRLANSFVTVVPEENSAGESRA